MAVSGKEIKFCDTAREIILSFFLGRLGQFLYRFATLALLITFAYGTASIISDLKLQPSTAPQADLEDASSGEDTEHEIRKGENTVIKNDSESPFLASLPHTLNEVGLTCYNKDTRPRTAMRGPHWVLYNYIKAEREFNCNETITYTTHGETEYLLDNLEALLARWAGPISVAVFAPAEEFLRAVNAIVFLRECPRDPETPHRVRDFVTFHLFFPADHFPVVKKVFSQADLKLMKADCRFPPNATSSKRESFTSKKRLWYPINVARNVARESANTHFVFPSDIELYPSPGLIPDFLAMIRRNDPAIRDHTQPRVFVNAIFEVEADAVIPDTKAELVAMLEAKTAIPFHAGICSMCHTVPGAKEWREEPYNGTMMTFRVAKRVNKFRNWEPIFIGTNADPPYDERLSWEGKADKMTQGFQLCVLDYDFHLLNGAFLVHRPGIKTRSKKTRSHQAQIKLQNNLINSRIMPQLKQLFGHRGGCVR